MRVELTVNGRRVDVDVEARTSLLDTLRNEVGLTGTHTGCEHGVCGCCNVMVNGRTVRSCLMLAAQARGATIMTVEGLADADGTLSPLQESFQEHHALQCGYCTPGILVGLWDFLARNNRPTREQIQHCLSGNLCRCTGYQQILDAVEAVVEREEATDA